MAVADVCRRLPARAARGAGYTLVEVVIASVILLVIALGILPLFTRSLASVKSGADSTEVANINRGTLEEFLQMPFGSPELTIDTGTEKVVEEKYLVHSGKWVPKGDPDLPADPAIWFRTTTVRQYGWGAVTASPADPSLLTVDPGLALPAGSPAGDVILKEIIVEIDRTSDPGIFGEAELTLRIFKSH